MKGEEGVSRSDRILTSRSTRREKKATENMHPLGCSRRGQKQELEQGSHPHKAHMKPGIANHSWGARIGINESDGARDGRSSRLLFWKINAGGTRRARITTMNKRLIGSGKPGGDYKRKSRNFGEQ